MNSDDDRNISALRLLRFRIRRRWSRLTARMGFQGKTLWDLIQLLAVPLLIAGATIIFNLNALRSEAERADTQRSIELDRAQQEVLQSYLRDMKELLLKEELPTSAPDSPVRQIARSNTLAAVRQLDKTRKGLLLLFLYDLNLIRIGEEEDAIVSLGDADLSDANLSDANLFGADLSDAVLFGADLSYANLSDANLSGADLSDANLFSANLRGANLSGANLRDAGLHSANLSGANLFDAGLFGANLNFADLSDADLRGAFLGFANLSNANLSGANLSDAVGLGDADLRDVDLRGAFLSGAEVRNEQLAQAKSLSGTTMPDGSKIETEEQQEAFKQQYGGNE